LNLIVEGKGEAILDLIYLEEDQASAFEQDNHRPEAMKAKYDIIKERFPNGPTSILDLGGGAGYFADKILAEFPSCEVTILDSSALLLNKNRARDRKVLTMGSVSEIDDLFFGRRFDVITMNFLLHHLVGKTRKSCWENCVETLAACRRHLAKDGVIIIAEHAFDGPFGTNIPSNTIFAITRIRQPLFVKFARRYFNTAGTGVCFRSERSWRAVFAAAGLTATSIFHMPWELGSIRRRLKFAALGLTSPSQRHFVCISKMKD
jgi:ubiquinone/menaquinone biosynthesis C-methylase UbiE